MPPLRRHQIAHLCADGWQDVLARDWDDELRACLAVWAQRNLPLVVTRQSVPREAEDAPVSLGLSAPTLWHRRLLALQVSPSQISWFREFPLVTEVLPELPRRARPGIEALCRALSALGVKAHAYGSLGWQHLTGMKYRHARSDLDIWVAVDDVDQADAAVHAMLRHAPTDPRLDGELLFTNGSAVAWREWLAWRDGACHSLLVKRLDGAAIERSAGLFARSMGEAGAA